MPTYEYECEKCRRLFEVRQRITEPALTTCEVCGGPVKRLLSPAPFILKGEGWYVTDYPSESRKKARDAEKPKSDASTSKAEKPAEKTTTEGGTSSSSSATGASPAPSAPAKSD